VGSNPAITAEEDDKKWSFKANEKLGCIHLQGSVHGLTNEMFVQFYSITV